MTMSVTITGIDRAFNEVDKGYQNLLAEVASTLETNLKSLTPVRTGRAQAGWHKTVTANQAVVENSVPYVPYLDKGTTKMKPANHGRGIVGPALSQTKGKYK